MQTAFSLLAGSTESPEVNLKYSETFAELSPSFIISVTLSPPSAAASLSAQLLVPPLETDPWWCVMWHQFITSMQHLCISLNKKYYFQKVEIILFRVFLIPWCRVVA